MLVLTNVKPLSTCFIYIIPTNGVFLAWKDCLIHTFNFTAFHLK